MADNQNIPSQDGDNLTPMHFSEFQKWQIESGRPQPVFDQSKGGWVVPGREDLFAKRTDMPLWQALAKEQGIGIFLNIPKPPSATPSPEDNTISNAQIPLDLKTGQSSEPAPSADPAPRRSIFDRLGTLFAGEDQAPVNHPWLNEPPESIAKRYLYTNGEYYFRDRNNDRAFSDEGERLKTPGHDPVVINSMLEVAKAKGWTSIHLKGSNDFMREAWYQAKLAGLDVTGFKPSAIDLARLAHDMPTPPPENTLANAATMGLTSHDATAKDLKQADTLPPAVKSNPLQGTVVAFGADPYKHDKRDGVALSYFIALKNSDGLITEHWGKDLQRLCSDLKLAVGDVVTLARDGKKTVEVSEPIHDPDGKLIRFEPKTSELNAWKAEFHQRATPPVDQQAPAQTPVEAPTPSARDRYTAFMNSSPADAIAKYPDMAPYYEILKRQIRDDLILVKDPNLCAAYRDKLKGTIGELILAGKTPTADMLPEVPPLPEHPSLALRAIAAEQAKIAETQGATPEQVKTTIEDVLRYGGRLEAQGIPLDLPKVVRENAPAGTTIELAPKVLKTFEDRDQKLSRGR